MQKILFYFISFEFGWFGLGSLFPLALAWVPVPFVFLPILFFFLVILCCFFIFDEDVLADTGGCHLYIRYPKTEAPVPLLGHRFILYLSVVPAHSDSSTHSPIQPWPFVMHGRVNHSYANAVKIPIYVLRKPAEATEIRVVLLMVLRSFWSFDPS